MKNLPLSILCSSKNTFRMKQVQISFQKSINIKQVGSRTFMNKNVCNFKRYLQRTRVNFKQFWYLADYAEITSHRKWTVRKWKWINIFQWNTNSTMKIINKTQLFLELKFHYTNKKLTNDNYLKTWATVFGPNHSPTSLPSEAPVRAIWWMEYGAERLSSNIRNILK